MALQEWVPGYVAAEFVLGLEGVRVGTMHQGKGARTP